MSFTAKLFSFEGRIGRSDWWLLNLLIGFVMIVGWFVAFAVLGGPTPSGPLDAYGKPTGPVGPAPDFGAFMLALMAPLLLTLWPSLAVQVKRWHDRDKSAAWIAINFIPWIGGIWAMIELGFLPGTPGGNRYGSGPGISADRVADIFDEVEQGAVASSSRADDAIARWQAEQARQAPQPSWNPAPAGGGGFGRRGVQPAFR